jgi:polyisoprenyl-phosphate glycosyltransferase
MQQEHIALVAPCYNEGEVAIRFLREVEQVVSATDARWTLIMVDDASTDQTLQLLNSYKTSAPNVSLRTISVAYNMGHQEAIYQGLLSASTTDATHFVVMDSDGEDDPQALVDLLRRKDHSIVFVARGKRTESLLFRLGYKGYRLLFRLITGRPISFGNYSMIDRRVLEAVLDRSFIHYAAFLSRQRARSTLITFDRRKRIDGRSKMSFKSLSMHAFKALIEYSEEVLLLFLKAFIGLAVVFLFSLITIVSIKLFTDSAIPGWASTLSVSLFNSMLICLGFFATGLLLVNTAQRRERAGRHLYRSTSEGARP